MFTFHLKLLQNDLFNSKDKEHQVQVEGFANGIEVFSSRFENITKGLTNVPFRKIKLSLQIYQQLEFDVKVQIKCISNDDDMSKIVLGNYRAMINNPTFSDFKVVVRGKEFHVHKAILAGASPVFFRMFTTDMKESRTNVCNIENIKPEAFEQMLNFIYCGDIPINTCSCNELLFETAAFFDIQSLRDICSQRIRSELSQENALKLYKFASVFEEELKELRSDAWEIIKRQVLQFLKLFDLITF